MQILFLVTGLITLTNVPTSLDQLVLSQSQMLTSPLNLISYYNEGYLGAINLLLSDQSDQESQLSQFYVLQSKVNLNNILFNDTSLLLQALDNIDHKNQTSFNINIIENQWIYQQRSTIFDFLTNIVQQINSISSADDLDHIKKSTADLIINYPKFELIIQDIFYNLTQDLNQSIQTLRNNTILIPIAFMIVNIVINQIQSIAFVIVLYFYKQVLTYEHRIIMILCKLEKMEIDKIVNSLRSVLESYDVSQNINIVSEMNQDKSHNKGQDQSIMDLKDQKDLNKKNKQKKKKHYKSLSGSSMFSFKIPRSLGYMLMFGCMGIIQFICFIPFYETHILQTQDTIKSLQDSLGIQVSFNKLVFSSQMIIVNKIISHKIQQKASSFTNMKMLQQIYTNQSQFWQDSFQAQFQLYGQSIVYLSELQIKLPILMNYTSSDICSTFDSASPQQQQIFAQICDSKSIVYLRKGLVNAFTSLNEFYIGNLDLIQGESIMGIEKLIKQQAYQSLVQEYYAVISYQFSQIIQVQQNTLMDLEITFQTNLYIFSCIIGAIFVSLSILFMLVYHKVQLQKMKNLKFSLTLLPQEKLEDQTIMFMLKTLAQQ